MTEVFSYDIKLSVQRYYIFFIYTNFWIKKAPSNVLGANPIVYLLCASTKNVYWKRARLSSTLAFASTIDIA